MEWMLIELVGVEVIAWNQAGRKKNRIVNDTVFPDHDTNTNWSKNFFLETIRIKSWKMEKAMSTWAKDTGDESKLFILANLFIWAL